MSGILLGARPSIVKPATARAYGVSWAGGASTQFSRLGEAAGFPDPVPGVGATAGSSPFDEIWPWSGMKEFNIINDAVSYEKGVDAEFSRSAYDTVVRIPKFWYKVQATGSEWQLWIANGPMTGYTEHPAFEGKDFIYYGKYKAGVGYVSRSAKTPLVNITRAMLRSNARNKGAHWDMLNIAAWSAVTMLYLVEYADWNSQAVIGRGYTSSGSAVIATGGTDSMAYHTGRPAGTDGSTSVLYRGIEDLWGNCWSWVDGINFSDTQAYYCLNRSQFGDDKSAGYTQLGYNCPSGSEAFPKSHGLDANASWLFLPASTGGSNATYIPDGWWTSSGWRVFGVGGRYGNGLSAGLFARGADRTSSAADAGAGGRLLYIP